MSGLKVWRIENFEEVPVEDERQFGKFYTGDSYIVLKKNVDKMGNTSYNIHMWIGSESTQDEFGACAMITTRMDDELGGLPVQYRETQGNESSTFLGYFKPAIHYKKGGVKSGFNHVKTNDYSDIKRLIWVRGRRQVTASEVEYDWSSLNQSDSFIFDMGIDIYVWNGPRANMFEKRQANLVARSIDDDERGGKATVHFVDNTRELVKFLGEEPESIPEGCPEKARSKRIVTSDGKVELYKVSDASGDVETTLVSDQVPFKQSMLDSGDVFLVSDTKGREIFVWKGKDASKEERKSAMKTAVGFISKFQLPSNTKITCMPDMGETALFKTLFKNWQDMDAQEGLGKTWSINKIAKVAKVEFDVNKLRDKPDLAAKYQLPNDGSGEIKVFRIENGETNEVEANGELYGGDCYIVAHTHEVEGTTLYYWIGNSATVDEVTALPILTVQMDQDLYGGMATQVRVTQGHEPPHFMLVFGEKPLMIHMGGTSREGGQSEPNAIRLIHVKQGVLGMCRMIEVGVDSSNLNSNDTFILIAHDQATCWIGKGACDAEKAWCEKMCEKMEKSHYTVVEEGSEDDAFWDALGGKKEYFDTPLSEEEGSLRLFECCDASGNFTVEEVVGDWTKSDLNEENVMLLDCWSAVYVWIGRNASTNERKKAVELAVKYINLDNTQRNAENTSIIRVNQEKEPVSFTGFFQGWST